MASSREIGSAGNVPALPAGKYKIEAVKVPALPAIVNVDSACYVLAANPIAVQTLADRFAKPVDGRTAHMPAAFGLLLIIATPEDDG